MSKTPILTKKQQKSSLSAKKAKTKETVRNVLASPYFKYWPLVCTEHHQNLKGILNQFLPKLLPDRAKIPWKELKKIPKSERKKFKEEYISQHFSHDYLRELGESIEGRDGLILGINDVTKALENNSAKSVLITEDVRPQLMVEHVVDQAVLLGIPILIVPELREILKEKCGVPSIAVAFAEYPRYKLVQETIEEITKKYPVPEKHINFNRALKLADDSVIVIEDNIIEDISKTNLGDVLNPTADKTTEEIEKKIVENEVLVNNVYLKRTARDKRAFAPEKSFEKLKRDDTNVDSSGFLSFSANSTGEQKVGKTYGSLKVSRIKGDMNRNKRKIQTMKERKTKGTGNKKIKKGHP